MSTFRRPLTEKNKLAWETHYQAEKRGLSPDLALGLNQTFHGNSFVSAVDLSQLFPSLKGIPIPQNNANSVLMGASDTQKESRLQMAGSS